MQNEEKGRRLPSPQPGSFGAAIHNSYMLGFWLGFISILFKLLNMDLAPSGPGYFFAALGVQSVGWAKFWANIFCVVAALPVSRASVEYCHLTGRNFVEDRIGFAKAGGQDIGFFSGLISIVVLIAIFSIVVPSWLSAWFRVPLIIVLSTMLGNKLSAFCARRVFTVLFGSNPIEFKM